MSDRIRILDLGFRSTPDLIGAFLVRTTDGPVLVESGPHSCLLVLESQLASWNVRLAEIRHLFLTHIHLDHAGAAGFIARASGCQVHVHPAGAPHLVDPQRLLASAGRIYGDEMESLWGGFLALPENQVSPVKNGAGVKVGDCTFQALNTPGHAGHHIAWLLDGECFSGDLAGMRLTPALYARLPLVPPELDFDLWAASLQRLKELKLKAVLPTHFGRYEDVEAHLAMCTRLLEETRAWVEQVMPARPEEGELLGLYRQRLDALEREAGLDAGQRSAYEKAGPAAIAPLAFLRYWKKTHPPEPM